MPVSHIGLTVSHLPTSCSFFLSALQPLGYRFLGQWGNQIGLGVNEADFFLTQETPGIKAGAAHVAFAAFSRATVREFYANALQAGGKPHGSPAAREDGEECFNAAVLDLDGNSVEVVFHEGAAAADTASSVGGKSRALGWREEPAENLNSASDSKSTMSLNTITSTASSMARKAMVPANSTSARSVKAPSVAPSVAPTTTSKTSAKVSAAAPVIQRAMSTPTVTPQSSNDNISISRKALVGTILGAAAGAAVAYAMCKSEEDSAKAEQAAYAAAKGATKHLQDSHPHLLQAKPTYSSPRSSPPRSVHSVQSIGETEYASGHYPVRAIEAAPSNYEFPSYQTVYTGRPETVYTLRPETESIAQESRVTMQRAQSYQESRKSNSIISSFVPDEQPREIPVFDYAEHTSAHSTPRSSHSSSKSSHSKAKSSSGASKHSNTSSKRSSPRSEKRDSSQSRVASSLHRIAESSDETPVPRSKTGSKASKTSKASKSGGTSVLGRGVVAPEYSPYPSSSEKEISADSSNDDLDTVVPSDSVSQIGSSSSRRRPSHSGSHASRRQSESGSHVSSSSKRDENRRLSEDLLLVDKKKKKKKHSSAGSSASARRASEAGTESTMTPEKYATKAFAETRSPAGSIHSLPVRGITPSMLGGNAPAGGMRGRSVVSYYG